MSSIERLRIIVESWEVIGRGVVLAFAIAAIAAIIMLVIQQLFPPNE